MFMVAQKNIYGRDDGDEWMRWVMVMVEYNVNCYDWRWQREREMGKKLRRMRGKKLKMERQ